ncbi:hypothetical protein Metfor_2746 [Methanoregula formicica SMSP]|uniref:Uncharacterized protein n=1 Tax=Methanoregula formicica (strain DSM 22288 / NBRC 105244 / SMSP) TaxID=593750 RepID=L0HIY6_METFS|nr:hypothetical protein Metfor_2746 [Methanoregula formicica SMSP]
MPAIIAVVALIAFLISLNFVILFIAQKEGLILATTIFCIALFIDLYTLVIAVHEYRADRRRASL